MDILTRDETAELEPFSRDQILRRERRQGKNHFSLFSWPRAGLTTILDWSILCLQYKWWPYIHIEIDKSVPCNARSSILSYYTAYILKCSHGDDLRCPKVGVNEECGRDSCIFREIDGRKRKQWIKLRPGSGWLARRIRKLVYAWKISSALLLRLSSVLLFQILSDESERRMYDAYLRSLARRAWKACIIVELLNAEYCRRFLD